MSRNVAWGVWIVVGALTGGSTGCTPEPKGVAAEYWFTLEEAARFDVVATSSIEAGLAENVELSLVVAFEDGRAPEPFTVDVTVNGETASRPADLDQETLVFPATSVSLYPCDAPPCLGEASFQLTPGFAEPRDVFVAIELLAYGTSSAYDAWEFLDLGVVAPEAAL